MEENTVNTNVIEAKVENNPDGSATASVPQKETWGQKIKKTWFWKNRGKVCAILGGAAVAAIGAVLGRSDDNDEDEDDSTDSDCTDD